MSEMIERCVKAVEECAWDWREQASEERIVRAVIEAMREPTAAMRTICTDERLFENIWREAIDEALK